MPIPENSIPITSSENTVLDNEEETDPKTVSHVFFTVIPKSTDEGNEANGEKPMENYALDEDDDRAFSRVVYVGATLGILALICFVLSALLPQSTNKFIWGILVLGAFGIGFVLLPFFKRYTPSGFTGLKILILVMFLVGAVTCILATIFTTSGGFLKYFIFPMTAILLILYSITLCQAFRKKEDGD